MRIVLLRNVRETANLSMKLYADRLGRALDGWCIIEDVRPWCVPTWRARRAGIAVKGLDYCVRYGVYPARLLGRRSDVFHIVDHAYAHLMLCLPTRRTVVTCHDLTLLKVANGEFGTATTTPSVASRLFQFSVRFLRRAGAVIAVSHATAQDLIKYLDILPERIHVIHSGVDRVFRPPADSHVRSVARVRFALDDRPVLLHVGTNWFYKNLEGVIRALALLRTGTTSRDPVLLKAGKRLSPTQCELARSLGVTGHIRELDFLAPEELQAAYWAADVLVFPSLWEGFGWPPLEAMASGTPVVCSDRGALGEVVGQAAAIVNPEDPRDIARTVHRVLNDDPFRARLVRAGLDRVKQFSWERAAEQTYRVYETVAQMPR